MAFFLLIIAYLALSKDDESEAAVKSLHATVVKDTTIFVKLFEELSADILAANDEGSSRCLIFFNPLDDSLDQQVRCV